MCGFKEVISFLVNDTWILLLFKTRFIQSDRTDFDL